MNIEDIKNHYKEPWRFHHTWNHVNYIIKNLIEWYNEHEYINLNTNIAEVINYTAMFHDIVYDPKRTDNEDQSIKLWQEYARDHKFSIETINAVTRIINSTKHPEESVDIFEKVFNRFDWLNMGYTHIITPEYAKLLTEYEQNIFKEYSFIPVEQYVEARIKFLNNAVEKRLITIEVKDFLTKLINQNFKR